MHSLYHSLLAQHPRQLTRVCCAPSTIAQLHRYFEDVVLENSLSALVIESLPTCQFRSPREITRLNKLGQSARNFFLFLSPEDTLSGSMLVRGKEPRVKSVVLERTDRDRASDRFVVIADARFSAVLASVSNDDDGDKSQGDLVIWTFEPDVVYSALEYLMARVTAEHSFHGTAFANAVRVSMPKATSLQLTLGVTTKLARLLQEQAEREIAVNRIATAIRHSLELESVLITAANEVGRALNVKCCAVRVAGELVGHKMTKCYFDPEVTTDARQSRLLGDLDKLAVELSKSKKTTVVDGDNTQEESVFAHAVVPLIYTEALIGFLLVRSDDASRVWAENELLLLHTVADQLTVAVNQAHMFSQMQQQALTDGLTGCYNRRSFDLQLEQQLHLATRMRQPLSLIMLDLDNFKHINDRAGHETGDIALRLLAKTLRAELRAVDIAARFGGDEFAIILPQATYEGALVVAERLRIGVQQTEVPGYGPMTASFGVATFPVHGSSRDTLVVAADRALYNSKHSGRNQVSVPDMDENQLTSIGPLVEDESLADTLIQSR